jgi:HlyD family type I secretion membrane fusion protein
MKSGMGRGADKGRGLAESKRDGQRPPGKWASWTTPEATAELLPGDIRALLERRRSPVAGALIGSVALLLVAAVAWTAWARVDEVVKAQGEVEPAERVKLMNHPRGGRIATLDVIDGQRVEAGQVLLTFAPEIDAKEEAELRGRWQGRLAEIAVLKAEIEGEPLQPPAELLSRRADLVAEAEARLIARREAREGQRDALQRNVEGHRAALRSAEAEIDRLRSGTVLLAQQADSVRQLTERGLYPRMKMVELERQLVDMRGELAKAEADLGTARASLAESESRQSAFDKDWRRELLEALSTAMAERDQIAEQLGAQTAVVEELVLKAPVDGIVQELKPAAAGQSVAANETILKLVPVADGLVIKALVANPDIGRVVPGMPAVVKVRAYDFARFGSIDGQVTRISADALTGEVPGELPSFAVEVATIKDHMGAGESLPVLPGMVVDVELLVGERTILSYLTDTLTTMKERAFKEG